MTTPSSACSSSARWWSTPRLGWPPMERDNQRTGPLFKLAVDPRVTRIGNVLRRTSLDELPQLLNVLQGRHEPGRPAPGAAPGGRCLPRRAARPSRVRPGITGLWQVEARDNPAFDAYQRLDLIYVENWSLSLDLVVLLGTAEQLVMRPFASRRQGERHGAGSRQPTRRRSPLRPDGRAQVAQARDRSTARRHVAWAASTVARSGDGAKRRRAATALRRRRGRAARPRRARPGTPHRWPSSLVRVGRCTVDSELIGLELQQVVHHRRATVDAQLASAAVRWPAPSPRRHHGSGTPSTRRRPGPGGHGSCRG